MLLVTAEQMREMDRKTIDDVGIPGIVLMERAALGAVDAVLAHFELTPGDRVALLCGGGNNGGDGFAMARMLSERQIDVWVGAMRSLDAYEGDAATNVKVLHALHVKIDDLSSDTADELTARLERIGPCDVVVDALLGTGLDRDVEGSYRAAIDWMSTQPAVFAVDIPSGLHADDGRVMGTAVRADATATFGHPKLGQALYPARHYVGSLYPIDIGIPASVTSSVGWSAEWLVGDRWLPQRAATMHKGDAGRVVAIGGQPGTAGAIMMTTRAALLSGAGLVVAGTYDETVPAIAPVVPEAMASPVLARTIEQSHAEELERLLAWTDVVAIGPGMGTHEGARETVENVLQADLDAVVLDADALNILADRPLRIADVHAEILVMTPHPGEAARLAGCEVEDVLADPVGTALKLAEEWDAIVVLKGAATVIAQHEPRRVAVNSSGNPGMASGGMGDALTGIVAAQLCEAVPAFEAVCTAVWVHGAAGDLAAQASTGQRGLTVSALLDALPSIWRDLEPA